MTSPTKVIDAHPETVRFPLMELPIVGFLLAMMAGSMNAWTLTNSSTFSTVQSGNVVSMGYWLVDGNWAKFAFPAISVLAFGLGSAVCGVLMTSYLRRGRNFTNAVLTSMTVLLIVLGILALTIVGTNPHDTANVLDFGKDHDMSAQWIAVAISFVAGAQGNAFHKNHGMLYGNVAVTFVVQMAFNFLVQSFFSKKGINGEPNLKWSGIFFLTLLGFAGGGAIGFSLDKYGTNGASVFLPAAIALALLVVSLTRRQQNVDPSQGGTFA
ncbi:YoaK family protein [Gordonia sp. VNK21]|uniref:YoaK family protein n=1 Tax=Gordonia sp. VNK21 TaxID=3382483 RepID=UPI0038D50DEC